MNWFGLPPGDFEVILWTLLVCIVCSVACALLGCYLVLRRMSLLGDAIGHGVLPGIALGFLFGGHLGSPLILVGAVAFGFLTAFLTETLHRFGKVPEDASMGIVFTSLFALGVILISKLFARVHLDVDCVFYGLLEMMALDTFPLFGLEIPRAFPNMAVALLLTLGFIVFFWKELKVSSFDPELAIAVGLSATVVHYLLMGLVAGVTVASFVAVGSIVVIAMLIVPAATAHLLTDRLGPMLVWSAVVATVSAVLGYFAARLVNSNVAGFMAVMAGAQFGLAVFLAPRHGVLAKLIRNVKLTLRIAREDVLATLYRQDERGGREVSIDDFPTGWRRRLALWSLGRQRQIQVADDGTLWLTPEGREAARLVVRSHRLWEAYLGKEFELPLDHLHAPATRMEHFIGPALQDELAAELQQPGVDPHGRAIPSPPARP
jgi:manganese/zinc/iron transport system permease protein